MINTAIDFAWKWWDSALGVFGTGIMISIAGVNGESTVVDQYDWAIIITGVCTVLMTLTRISIMIDNHFRKIRKEKIKDKVKMKG